MCRNKNSQSAINLVNMDSESLIERYCWPKFLICKCCAKVYVFVSLIATIAKNAYISLYVTCQSAESISRTISIFLRRQKGMNDLQHRHQRVH